MRVLLLRLEAPLMALGGPVVDSRGPTRRFPGLAMVTGLLGNALGWRHGDAEPLEGLQRRLRFATALVRPGTPLTDYQTVDLGRPHMLGSRGWTTRGRPEGRGGASGEGTHIRLREHLADALLLVALRLEPELEAPTLDDLAAGLLRPARPLFLGRKPCLPSAPLLLKPPLETPFETESLGHALQAGLAKLGECRGARRVPTVRVELPAGEPAGPLNPTGEDEGTEALVDVRDWRNQIHAGERLVRRADLPWPAPGEAGP